MIQENGGFAGTPERWGMQPAMPSVTSTGSMVRKAPYTPPV
jgi:hypothetical protein